MKMRAISLSPSDSKGASGLAYCVVLVFVQYFLLFWLLLADAVASFLHRQKGRLAVCKHRQVPAIAEAAASQALVSLQAADCSQQTLQ